MSWLRPKQKKPTKVDSAPEKGLSNNFISEFDKKASLKNHSAASIIPQNNPALLSKSNKDNPDYTTIQPSTVPDNEPNNIKTPSTVVQKPVQPDSAIPYALPPQSPKPPSQKHEQQSHSQPQPIPYLPAHPPSTERKVGVLTVKILRGRGVISENKAQFITSHYSNYKNDVHQRPFAVISFDKNEVIAAPVGGNLINPVWEYRANFDVSRKSNVVISFFQQIEQNPISQQRSQGYSNPNYKGANTQKKSFCTLYLGKTEFTPEFVDNTLVDNWFQIDSSGFIHVKYSFTRKEEEKLTIDQFDLLKVIGRGSFGKVFQVCKKDTKRIYAMKVLSKSKIVKRSEVAHTLAERDVLAMINHPFIVPLKFSFQTPEKLYLVLAFVNGGELFHHLHREGRFDQHLSRFYAAELLCALECLHSYDVIYRDLKPENILLDYSGHVALCDFGLCKLNMSDDRKTNTFCGTPEYLAPELLLGHGYTKTVDWWTFGILLYEMLTGLPPFYSENPNEMYRRVLEDPLLFPNDMGSRAKSLIKGLLIRDPRYRLGCNGASEIKAQHFFAEIDWDLLLGKKYEPPFRPMVSSSFDTSNFEEEFTAELPEDSYIPDSHLSETIQRQFDGFTYDGGGGAFSLSQSVSIYSGALKNNYEGL
ncbi:hypothetical protein BB560_000207 [Smittium megazygosporum]|uniref:non-specific serine/threonine protein kinase n=1 Tax=Smittium megazygosporum TaxID=133381 RepID=A0A2T9ZL67_9FUNG|nr:hypothetical protein BB560_000207 [Smittium megazygosporum]